jgi:hypothetical protein
MVASGVVNAEIVVHMFSQPLQSNTRSLQVCYIQTEQSKLGGSYTPMMHQELSHVPLTQAALVNDEFVEKSSEHVQHMLQAGLPWREILTRLATAGENLAGQGASVSILILDENGLLRNGASPNLPPGLSASY